MGPGNAIENLSLFHNFSMPFIVGSHREQEHSVKTAIEEKHIEKGHTVISKDTDGAEKVPSKAHTW